MQKLGEDLRTCLHVFEQIFVSLERSSVPKEEQSFPLECGCIHCSNSQFLQCHMFVQIGGTTGALAHGKVMTHFGCDQKVSL